MLETIADIFKEAYKRNWITARDGNASLGWNDRDYFFITPSGVRKQFLQPDMFKKIQVVDDGYQELDFTAISSNLRPSGELPLHLGLQRKIDTEIRVVLHMHPTYTVAAMYAGYELSNLVDQFPELGRYSQVGNNVPMIPPICQELADATIPALGLQPNGSVTKHVVGMDRHGVVAVDTSPWRAFEHIERLEHICKIVLSGAKNNFKN